MYIYIYIYIYRARSVGCPDVGFDRRLNVFMSLKESSRTAVIDSFEADEIYVRPR